MDYKYIEQLLERYFACETSLEEEAILRSFFRQKEIPEKLLPYRALFLYEGTAREEKLDNDFDRKILALVEKPVIKARKVTFTEQLKPFFKAAAVVAVIMTVGNAAQHSFQPESQDDYNYESYTDTYSDPESAYQGVTSALRMVSEGINKAQEDTDSLAGPLDDRTDKMTE